LLAAARGSRPACRVTFLLLAQKKQSPKEKSLNTSHLAVALKVEIRLGTGDGDRERPRPQAQREKEKCLRRFSEPRCHVLFEGKTVTAPCLA